jgi:hypothetical protein
MPRKLYVILPSLIFLIAACNAEPGPSDENFSADTTNDSLAEVASPPTEDAQAFVTPDVANAECLGLIASDSPELIAPRFTNSTSFPVSAYWVDQDGNEHEYDVIRPSKSIQPSTVESDAWCFRNKINGIAILGVKTENQDEIVIAISNEQADLHPIPPRPQNYTQEVISYPNLELRTEFGNSSDNDVITGDIFAVWWDKKWNLAKDAQIILDTLITIRQDLIENYGMMDPPNPSAGYYVNIYFHQPGPDNDNYPDYWDGLVSWDMYEMPFMALGNWYEGEGPSILTLYHEAIHLYQTSSIAPKFQYSEENNGFWYMETLANWYTVKNFESSGYMLYNLYAIPYEAMWYVHAVNAHPLEPDNWQRNSRHYAFDTFLRYLELAEDVSPKIFTESYYLATYQYPQEYLYDHIENLHIYFGDWAAHNAADFDYLPGYLVDLMHNDIANLPDQEDINPYAAILTAEGTQDTWFTPETDFLPGGWGYNVIKVNTDWQDSLWHIEFAGESQGSLGANARFEVRVAVIEGNGRHIFYSVPLKDFQNGNFSFETSAEVQEFYVTVASVPEHFTGNQNYPYAIKIMQE